MFDRINAVPWGNYSQPEWNKPGDVADALERIARADAGAYDSLLYAVGNNHAGTYYPVLIPVVPFLEEIILKGEAASQRAVLCVLGDLFGSFQPEHGYEQVDLPDGGKQDVAAAFKQRLHALGPVLERIASSDSQNASLAGELRQTIAEDAA